MLHGIHDDRYLSYHLQTYVPDTKSSLLSSNACGGSGIVYVILAVDPYNVSFSVRLFYRNAYVCLYLLSTLHEPFELPLLERSEYLN